MSAFLPTALLPVAGLLALVLVWPRMTRQPLALRVAAEAFGLALIAVALVQAGWLLLWLIERQW